MARVLLVSDDPDQREVDAALLSGFATSYLINANPETSHIPVEQVAKSKLK